VSENQDVSKVKQAFKKINSTNGPGATSDSSGSISIVLEPNPSANGQASIDKPLPVAFANATDAKWFVRPPSGGQFGPAPASLLASWVAESRVTADSLLCQEGTSEWQMASTLLPELFAADQTAIGSLVAAQSSAASAIIDPAVVRSDAIQKKRMKKRRQQLTLVVLLATVSMVLFSILIFVLVFQNGKPPV